MQRDKNRYYSIHHIVTVKTNLADIDIPDCFLVGERFNPNIEIIQGDLNVATPQKGVSQSRNYFYWVHNSSLFMDYNVPFLNAKLIVNNLEGKTKIQISRVLNRFGRVELPSFNSVLDIKLIQKGFTLLHSGCLNYKGQSFLITASRDTGKTSTVLSLFDGRDFKFMSDDLTIISEKGEAYSYPEKVGVSPHTLTGGIVPPYSRWFSIKEKAAKHHFLTLLLGRFLNMELVERKEIPYNLTEDRGKIEKVFILKGGSEKEEIKLIDNADAVEMILSATMGLINPSKTYLLNFYAYVCDFSLYDLLVEKRRIIEEALRDAECYEVKSNRVEKYPEMIRKVIVDDE